MSGGQRQTVAIARALYFNARILIMDEPCAALGPAETRMVLDTIRRLKAEGIGIFLISHDMSDVFEVCDRATVMKNGAVVDTVRVADVTRGRRARDDHPRRAAAGGLMQYRPLGRTGWNISTVSFGAWAIGGTWGPSTTHESIARAAPRARPAA